jgi:hypothetical protein
MRGAWVKRGTTSVVLSLGRSDYFGSKETKFSANGSADPPRSIADGEWEVAMDRSASRRRDSCALALGSGRAEPLMIHGLRLLVSALLP